MDSNQTYHFPLPQFSHSPIDIHSHFNHGSPFDCPEEVIHLRGLDFVRSEYVRTGIQHVGMSTYASVVQDLSCIAEENRYLHSLTLETPWMYQWVVIDPRQEETWKQAEEMLSCGKVLGIKLHPTYHKYDVLDYGDRLCSFASRHNTVILMHPQRKVEMVELADRYPDMKLIIAHLGSLEHIEAVKRARHGNIYVDTSGGNSRLNNIVEHAVSVLGSRNILFGTDTYSVAFQFGRIALSNLSMEDKENILWRNAAELFPKAFG